jgi:hypothetical protein
MTFTLPNWDSPRGCHQRCKANGLVGPQSDHQLFVFSRITWSNAQRRLFAANGAGRGSYPNRDDAIS